MNRKWAAHGRYLARESATHNEPGKTVGFGASGPIPNVAATLSGWQKADDPRVFKLIISPEFGDRLDLEAMTRDLLARMESDLGSRLQWVATMHYNTEHPHVHVALRGITEDKQPLRLDRSYIQHGIRGHAESLATRQIGYRTVLDAEEAERREIQQMRYTSLDRILNRGNTIQPGPTPAQFFALDFRNSPGTPRQHHLKGRLIFLEKLELAQTQGSNRWLIRSDFEPILHAMQGATDRQRVLAAHSAILLFRRATCQI